MGKITYEYVKNFIEKESNSGCILLSSEYINSRTKMKLKCPICGEPFDVNWDKFKAGQRKCNNCKRKELNDKKRFTIEKVQEYVENNSECKLISKEYKDAKTELEFLCSCGNTFNRSLDGFKSSKHKKCSECTNKEIANKHRLGIDYVKRYIEDNSDCKLLSTEYIDNSTPLKILCGCGNVFYRSFDVFTRNKENHECPKCSAKRVGSYKKYTYEEVKKFIENNSECKLLSTKYNNRSENLILKCNCGNIFETTFSKFKCDYKRKCNDCSGVVTYTIDDVREFVELNSNCILLSTEYNNMYDKLNFKCNCGEEFTTTFGNFKFFNKRQCDKCGYNITASKLKLSYEEVKEYIEKTGTKLLSKTYINNSQPLLLKCTCGKEFERSFGNFKTNSHVCPDCNNSNGERLIHEYLVSKTVNNKSQYRFDDCRGKKLPLPFDFAVFDKNNNLKFLIEFQGEQHFRPIKFFGGQKGFKKRKLYDKIKKDYCSKNNIDILYILYNEENMIDIILEGKLIEHDLIQHRFKEAI